MPDALPPQPIARAFALVVGGALLAAPLPEPVHAQAQWPTTTWRVECSNATKAEVGDTCTSVVGAKGHYRAELEAASQWLAGHGFRAPHILQTGMTPRYYAEVADEEMSEVGGGRYDPPSQGSDDGRLFLASDLAADGALGGEATHELFHGVQQAYHPVGQLLFGSDSYDPSELTFEFPPTTFLESGYSWIVEGSAEAVRLAFGRHAGRSFGGRPPRRYDLPLHLIGYEGQRAPYRTAHFWLGLGEMIGSTDRVAYLTSVWEAIAAAPDIDNGGLAAVDLALRDRGDGGLHDLYPQFIARHANDARYYETVPTVSLEIPGAGGSDRAAKQAAVRAVAARAYRLEARAPAETEAELRIELTGAQGAGSDLHLIVDDQRHDASTGGGNVFTTTLAPGAQEDFLVRAANVAEDAAASERRAFALEFSLEAPRPDLARCSFRAELSGAVGGTYAGEAVVQFEASGSEARVTDLTLNGDGFQLKTSLERPLTVGTAAGTRSGGALTTSAAIEGLREVANPFGVVGEDDFVTFDFEESREIRWGELPASVRDAVLGLRGQWMAARGNAADTATDEDALDRQIGDVAVRGVVRGQLTSAFGEIAERAELGQADRITFRATFNAGGAELACDPEGFAERANQWSGQAKLMGEALDQAFGAMEEAAGGELPEEVRAYMEMIRESLETGRAPGKGGEVELPEGYEEYGERMKQRWERSKEAQASEEDDGGG